MPYSFSSASPPCFSFSTGASLTRASRIVPVFLPFAGCPGRCVFCAQDKQTGSTIAPLQQRLAEAEQAIRLADSPELAFYGGTFTALPSADRRTCLAFLRHMLSSGMVSFGRCSTRPDCLSTDLLNDLRTAGLDMVELGIQSFNNVALSRSKRGYDGQIAKQGCLQVQQAELKLGIQLLPGMPGVTPKIFLADVDTALELKPACLRFYPCLVPEGTALSSLWRQGDYSPWSEEETVHTLGEALRRAWAANIPVLRLSVAPEAAFDAIVLAGPRHPALGSMIQAEALLRTVQKLLPELKGNTLHLPQSCQGYLYGQHGSLRAQWNAMGLPPSRIIFNKNLQNKGFLKAIPE